MGLFSGYECDLCGATVTYYGAINKNLDIKINRKMLIVRARAAGWQIGNRVYCPHCKYEVR